MSGWRVEGAKGGSFRALRRVARSTRGLRGSRAAWRLWSGRRGEKTEQLRVACPGSRRGGSGGEHPGVVLGAPLGDTHTHEEQRRAGGGTGTARWGCQQRGEPSVPGFVSVSVHVCVWGPEPKKRSGRRQYSTGPCRAASMESADALPKTPADGLVHVYCTENPLAGWGHGAGSWITSALADYAV